MASMFPTSFPKGLRVLLIDDRSNIANIEAQLRQPELQYAVTSCETAGEALSMCRRVGFGFDVVLADVSEFELSIVIPDDTAGRSFISAVDNIPVVLMSEDSTTVDVMRAVQLGAVDFLDKPLSVLKLKNIWQHSVRRMMQRTSLYNINGHGGPSFSEPVFPCKHNQLSISECLPSSLTGPICPNNGQSKPDDLIVLNDAEPVKGIKASGSYNRLHQSSIDSPGTPSAGTQALPGGTIEGPMSQNCDTITTDQSHESSNKLNKEAASSGDSMAFSSQNLSYGADVCSLSNDNVRASADFKKPVAAEEECGKHSDHVGAFNNESIPGSPLMASSFAAASLPASLRSSMDLTLNGFSSGYGSFQTSNNAPLLIKSRGTSLDSTLSSLGDFCMGAKKCSSMAPGPFAPTAPAASAPPPLPEDFLKLDKFGGEARSQSSGKGPIGLKLRKSRSFLDLINATVSSSSSLQTTKDVQVH